MYVPFYYGLENFGPPKEIKISDGENIDLSFKGNLRENQVPVVETFLNAIKKDNINGGLLELPCAYGKTVLSLYLISKLKKKTMIIGLFTSFIAQVFCGPSQIFGLPGESILLMCIG